jgi:hypothetical protein
MASVANAATLVVMGVNTGSSGTATGTGTNPPLTTPGAKGFLIGLDTNDVNGAEKVFTAVQQLKVSGAIVQILAPNAFADGDLASPNVQNRTQAGTANSSDLPPGATHFRNEDSYWWDSPQTIDGDSRAWSPVATGIQFGTPGDGMMELTAQLGAFGENVGPGVARLLYVVATGDLTFTGVIARTAAPENGTGPLGGPTDQVAVLDFETASFIPEPSSVVLAGLGMIGLALAAWRKRRAA